MSKTNDVIYPQNPEEWQIWLENNLGIACSQGPSMVLEERFPFDRLIDLWEDKFSSENGYSPSFIPALIRNKVGFVKWVYLDSPEPNWMNSDE